MAPLPRSPEGAASRPGESRRAQTAAAASSAEKRGDTTVAARLEVEAQDEDRLYAQVRAMIEGLPEPAADGTA